MMASYVEEDAERDVPMQLEGDPNVDKMAQQVQNLFKFSDFYDQMNFNPEQRSAMTKAIIKLSD